jgi:hypothetical protein
MSGFIAIAGPGFLSWSRGHPGEVLNLPVILHFQKFESGWKINQIQRKII